MLEPGTRAPLLGLTGMPRSNTLREAAAEAEKLAEICSYGRDKARLKERAEELRRRAEQEEHAATQRRA